MTFQNMKTGPKVLWGVLSPLVFLLVLAGVAVYSIMAMVRTNQWVEHTHQVLTDVAGISASAVNMETGMRGFLLSGKESFLDPYMQGQQDTYSQIDQLKNTVSDNPVQVSRLNEAEKILQDWQNDVTEPMIGIRRNLVAGKPTGKIASLDDLGNLVGEARGKAYFDKFRGIMGGVHEEEAKLLIVREQENTHTVNVAYGTIAACVVIALGIGVILALGIGRAIAGPINQLNGVMRRLAGGEKDIDIPGTGRGDEIGDMAKAVGVFRDSMIKADELATREAERNKNRELRTARIEKATREFDSGISQLLSTVSASAEQMGHTATLMLDTANVTNQRASTVAAASEEASANVQSVATATEELSSSIGEISRQIAQSSSTARRAVEQAENTNRQIQGLVMAAQKVGEVVSLISNIAKQTNLLALNATIEAARAGESGKGFAVVANEVKGLANETAKATEEISQQIASIQTETETAVSAIQSITRTIDEINEVAGAIAAAIEEQGAATDEIARNIQQASVGTNDVSANIVEVREAVGNTEEAAGQVSHVADDLRRRAEELKSQVGDFLGQVRTA